MPTEQFEDGSLKLTLDDNGGILTLVWQGRSVAREPGLFLLPILTRLIERGEKDKKRIVLDFRKLEYLNSSTVTPIIRVLEQAKRGTAMVSVIYDAELKWQALSFSALYLFQSLDGRVTVESR
ncbi:MAG: hypothetical protein HYS27_27335 [Deltaproteobacteria bacterium]|nr:hypothetical protein [Deltaproteobacteria bacterium]